MAGQMLQLNDLGLCFPGQTSDLFHIPQFNLAAGASLGLAGPSGAGKTSLLHCLAGIEKPTSGSILWGDSDLVVRSPRELAAWRREQIGLVFQDFHLVEGLSALDNVLLPINFSGWRVPPTLRERASALLDRVGLNMPQRRAELLSRGERQRVAVARALLHSPPIVLADEPTASLDPANRDIIGSLLLDLVREHGATLVVVTHETDLLARLDVRMSLQNGSLHPWSSAT